MLNSPFAQSCAHGLAATVKMFQPIIHRMVEGGIAIGTFILSWKMYWWAATYISSVDPANGVNAAAMVAAVLGPLSGLQGYVLAKYISSCTNGINGNNGAPKQ